MPFEKVLLGLVFLFSQNALGYEGPSPLKDIGISFSVAFESGAGLFSYSYKLTNPTSNDGDVSSFTLAMDTDKVADLELSATGLTQCSIYAKHTSDGLLAEYSAVPVGSTSPSTWACSYARLASFPVISYAWSASKEKFLLKPGSSLGLLSLTSRGIPAIRDARVDPFIDRDALPDSYEENLQATIDLEEKVKWIGKTIGPKAPPKIFNASEFLKNLIVSKEQAFALGWIKNKGILISLDSKLNDAQKKIAGGDLKTAKNVLNAFLNEVKSQDGKGLSSEAYALLYFNGKYLIDHI